MKIKTSLNIKKALLKRIQCAADRTELSRSRIIVLLFRRMSLSSFTCLNRAFYPVRYQQCDEKDSWHCFHIAYWPGEYEVCCDLRKVMKLSSSAVLALAVELYLDELIEELLELPDRGDKYTLNLYCFEHKIEKYAKTWKIYWGIPEKYL